MRDQAPVRAGGERPVDRQAVLVPVEQRRAAVELDAHPARLVIPAAEPVRPRVEQRDSEHGAVVAVGGKAAADPEQLLAALAQRAADHPGSDREARGQIAFRRDELDQPCIGHTAKCGPCSGGNLIRMG